MPDLLHQMFPECFCPIVEEEKKVKIKIMNRKSDQQCRKEYHHIIIVVSSKRHFSNARDKLKAYSKAIRSTHTSYAYKIQIEIEQQDINQ